MSSKEKAILLVLKPDVPVDISYFSIIYKKHGHGTFTSNYKDTYKSVQQNLIRMGILIAYEDRYGDSKLARIRLVLPNIFRQYLSSPFENIKEDSSKAILGDVSLRKKNKQNTG